MKLGIRHQNGVERLTGCGSKQGMTPRPTQIDKAP